MATLGTTNIFGNLTVSGTVSAYRVIGAVYNDIVDVVEADFTAPIQYGKVYIKTSSKGIRHEVATKYADRRVVGIASDTFGICVGPKKRKRVPQLPLAVSGFVLAYVDNIYPPGTPLTSSSTGGLTKAGWRIRVFFPERILATFYKVEESLMWENIDVNGRHWVKVR